METLYTEKTQYQNIEIRKLGDAEYQLVLDGMQQINTIDEAVYHETAIFGGLTFCETMPKKSLILGGGDGCAAARIFEACGDNADVTLVEIDERVVDICKQWVGDYNDGALDKVKLQIKDASFWVTKCRKNKYDFIFADYPDPFGPAYQKIFCAEHYAHLKRIMKDHGVLVVQSGPALWMPLQSAISTQLRKAGFKVVVPFKAPMITGIQGFWLCMNEMRQPDLKGLGSVATYFDEQAFNESFNHGKSYRQKLKERNDADVPAAYLYCAAIQEQLI